MWHYMIQNNLQSRFLNDPKSNMTRPDHVGLDLFSKTYLKKKTREEDQMIRYPKNVYIG